jgi:hypothetical protein
MGDEATRFLDNVIAYERRFFCRTYFFSNGVPARRGKERTQRFVFRINCVPSIFGKNVKEDEVLASVEKGLLPRIECSGDEIGYWIYKSRKRGVSDEKIYGTLTEKRGSFLEDNNLCESDFAIRGKSIQLYDAVRDAVRDLAE